MKLLHCFRPARKRPGEPPNPGTGALGAPPPVHGPPLSRCNVHGVAVLGGRRLSETLSSSTNDVFYDAPESPLSPLADSSAGPSRKRSDPFAPQHVAQLVASDALLQPSEPSGVGCLPLAKAFSIGNARPRLLRSSMPAAGSSFKRKSVPDGIGEWSEAPATSFYVRGLDYMQTRQKIASSSPLYRLVTVDVWSTEFKIAHIARHIQLPAPSQLGDQTKLRPSERLPPQLIFNIQLPNYSPSLFGGTDGKGHSIVYIFQLPDGFVPDDVQNKAALGLLQRFVHDEREADGMPTRDRLKLIARVANVEEWAAKAPLSSTEYRLLLNYNDKPLLTRPQQAFFLCNEYLEVDLDVHTYSYIARRGFTSFHHKLDSVVFENAFVIQGNRPEELPELVLGAARVKRVDFKATAKFPAIPLDSALNGSPDLAQGQHAQ